LLWSLSLLPSFLGAQTLPESLKKDLHSFKETRSVCSSSVVDPHAKGAYFRKIESAPSETAVGLTGKLTLPSVTVDPKRLMPKRAGDPSWWEGPLDRPSVYLGVSAPELEVDAGLSWERVMDDQGTLTDAYAFRPFWRVSSQGRSVFGPPAETTKPSFKPGQSLDMTLSVVGDGQLELEIKGEGSPDYSIVFAADGLPVDAAGHPRTFKRVNAIDQYRLDPAAGRKGNEGADALPTAARALGGAWTSAGVLQAAGSAQPLSGKACRVVLSGDRAATAPPSVVAGSPTPAGGETIDLAPAK
jgi:hypothetical protein